MMNGEEVTDRAFADEATEQSWLKGDLDPGVLPSGEVAGLISGIPAVREVIEEMVS